MGFPIKELGYFRSKMKLLSIIKQSGKLREILLLEKGETIDFVYLDKEGNKRLKVLECKINKEVYNGNKN